MLIRFLKYEIYTSTTDCLLSKTIKNFSASKAAMQPEPAAVTACRKFLSCTSPQANTPATLVLVESGWVIRYPSDPFQDIY